MAKTALVAGEHPDDRRSNQLAARITGFYEQTRDFLTDVRAEMRKVVVPNRKEVQATTTVVLVTVFVFALYFWIVDTVFNFGLTKLMDKLVGS